MYEHRSEPLVSRRLFLGRMAGHGLGALALVLGTLWIGMAGYRWFEGLSWIDAYLNAAMILGGMGPVAELHTTAGKLFAGCYAIYCGIALIGTTAVIFAPVIHRVLHKFHLEDSTTD